MNSRLRGYTGLRRPICTLPASPAVYTRVTDLPAGACAAAFLLPVVSLYIALTSSLERNG